MPSRDTVRRCPSVVFWIFMVRFQFLENRPPVVRTQPPAGRLNSPRVSPHFPASPRRSSSCAVCSVSCCAVGRFPSRPFRLSLSSETVSRLAASGLARVGFVFARRASKDVSCAVLVLAWTVHCLTECVHHGMLGRRRNPVYQVGQSVYRKRLREGRTGGGICARHMK